jgi:hypothetical protein
VRAKSVLIYLAVFVALAAVLFVGAFALNSYNWSTFWTWDFDPWPCAGYLGMRENMYCWREDI